MRVYLETIRTLNRRGRTGVRQVWVAEDRCRTDPCDLIGRGRTRRAAIANMGPRTYEMDFDEIAWKVNVIDGATPALDRIAELR